MPCQSYDSSWDRGSDSRKIAELKKQCDKLARIACKALTELEKNEVEDMLLLGDDEVRQWWQKHKEDDAREQARKAEAERKERVKQEALASLSDEAKELLGLTSKKKSGKRKSAIEDIVEVIEDDEGFEVDSEADWPEEEIIDLGQGIKVRMIKR